MSDETVDDAAIRARISMRQAATQAARQQGATRHQKAVEVERAKDQARRQHREVVLGWCQRFRDWVRRHDVPTTHLPNRGLRRGVTGWILHDGTYVYGGTTDSSGDHSRIYRICLVVTTDGDLAQWDQAVAIGHIEKMRRPDPKNAICRSAEFELPSLEELLTMIADFAYERDLPWE